MPDNKQIVAWSEISKERARRASDRADKASERAQAAIARAEALIQQQRVKRPPADNDT